MPTPPTTELGHVANTGWGGRSTFGYPLDEAEESAAWQWPASIATADRMSRHPQVQAVWWALTLPMRRDIWAIDPQDADPARVDMLADDIDLPILNERGERTRRPKPRRRGRFSWPEHLRLALLHLRWGCMFFEPVYDALALEQTGQARLRKLAPRFPRTLSHIDVAADGGLVGIRQWGTGPGAAKEVTIPVDRLIAYVHNREGANWHGQSIFRAMYRPYELADRSERVEAMTGERNGMGVPQAVYNGPHPESQTQSQIDAANEAAQAWRAGDYSAAAMPPGWRIHLTGVEGTLPDLDKPISRHYGLMAKSVQAMFMELGTTAAGHRALGETFVDFFAAAVGGIADGIADVTTQHVVEDWWDLNFGPDDPAPAVVAAPIDAETDIPPEALVALVNANVITPDADIEATLRTRYRLPAQAVSPAPTSNLAFLGQPVAASRRRPARRVAAATAPTWEERLAEAMAAVVDPGAIAAAVEAGTDPADAVAAGLADDLAPLEGVLADLWAEGWEAGVARAVDRVPVAASRPVHASLSNLLANVRALTASVVGSLRERLTSAVAAAQPGDELRDMLAGLASDHAAAGRIVVTETQRAMVAAAAETWRGAGVSSFRWVRASGDSDDCEFACDERDGTEGDWDDLPPLHPNCSCEVEPA